MTLQQVLDFLAVAQHGSVHAAARATGQTQPALTRSLRRLETSLGTALFERHSGGVRLNEAGVRFLSHARRLCAEARHAQESIAQWLGERLGRVTYGISAAPSLLLAPGAIQRFRAEYPDVELRCHGGLYRTLAPLLRDRQLDFAICPSPPEAMDAAFEAQTLIDSAMVVVARRGHPLAATTRLKALAGVRFVIGAPRGQPGAGIFDAFERAGVPPPTVELHTDALLDTAAVVAGSECLAMIPSTVMHTGLLRERLAIVPIEDWLPAYSVCLLRRGDVPPTPAAAALQAWFAREAAYFNTQRGPARPKGEPPPS
jgi:DNA-binding transcriptional LysR family regulator